MSDLAKCPKCGMLMCACDVERFWVSDIHPGEPDEYGKSIMLEVVRASDYDALRAERDGLLSARDDLTASNERLQAEVERLTWNERTYFAEAERLRTENAALWAENEAKAQGLREALMERDHYMARSVMNDADALRSALVRALNLLRIGMDTGLEPREKDEANALLITFGYGEAFTKSLHEIIGVDMAKGPDVTVTHSECSGEPENQVIGVDVLREARHLLAEAMHADLHRETLPHDWHRRYKALSDTVPIDRPPDHS